MNIPTIFDWIERFDHLRGEPALLILFITSALIALFWDWRLALFALIVQYLVVALLFVDLLEPRLAIIKVFVGMFVCLILYWTARQIDERYQPNHLPDAAVSIDNKTRKPFTIGPFKFSYRAVMRTVVVVLAAIVLAVITRLTPFSLPGAPDHLPYINQAVLILMGMGVVGVALSSDPLAGGMSLFTFLTGFELYFAALDTSVTMLVALAGLNFIIALAAAYLSQVRLASQFKLSNDR